jgi:hypothetical protein
VVPHARARKAKGEAVSETSEKILFFKLQSLDHSEKIAYAERGRVCLQVKREQLHLQRLNGNGEPCSMSQWIQLAAPWGYASCFAAMRDMEELKDMPAEALNNVPQSNFSTLRQLSTAVRNDPSVIQAAQTQQADKFINTVKQMHPNQHLESRKPIRFVADESQAKEIEETLALAMERGAINRTEALLAICIDYRASVVLEDLPASL